MGDRIRILIADDQPLVRRGLRATFADADDFEVVAEADNGMTAVTAVLSLAPDVALVDIDMPIMDGLAVVREVCAGRNPSRTKVIVLTMYDRDEYVFEALRSGASGFVLKDSPTELLIEAVRTTKSGHALLSPSVTRRLIQEFTRKPELSRSVPPSFVQLTEREREVFQLLVKGHRNEDVAELLGLGAATVKSHAQHLYHKLGVRDRVQAVIYAYEHGLA